MLIETILVPGDSRNQVIIGNECLAVVIDVLRVCSTIVSALDSGADRIYTAGTIEEAFAIKEGLLRSDKLPGQVILGGERQGVKVEGFDLGNSPREYTSEVVEGKTLILSSTNGTRAVKYSLGAAVVSVSCFLNAESCAWFIQKNNRDVVFYLSGREGEFSYEDAAGAGAVIFYLLESQKKDTLILSDSSRMCLNLFKIHRENLEGMCRGTKHGKYLISLGFGDDITYCARLNKTRTVPVLENEYFTPVRELYDYSNPN